MIKKGSLILTVLIALVVVTSCGRAVSPVALKHLAEGQKLYGLMQYEDAIKEFNEAVKSQPSFSLAYLGIGKCLAETGRFDDGSRSQERRNHVRDRPGLHRKGAG